MQLSEGPPDSHNMYKGRLPLVVAHQPTRRTWEIYKSPTSSVHNVVGLIEMKWIEGGKSIEAGWTGTGGNRRRPYAINKAAGWLASWLMEEVVVGGWSLLCIPGTTTACSQWGGLSRGMNLDGESS